jgi:hypothetical protein
MKLLRYEPINSEYEHVVVANKIVRLSKSKDGEITFIHLTNGEILKSSDSIKILEARLGDNND